MMDVSEGGGLVENRAVYDFLNTRCLTIAGRDSATVMSAGCSVGAGAAADAVGDAAGAALAAGAAVPVGAV